MIESTDLLSVSPAAKTGLLRAGVRFTVLVVPIVLVCSTSEGISFKITCDHEYVHFSEWTHISTARCERFKNAQNLFVWR